MRDEFDDVLDGVIYGAALGAGFGAAESFLYVLGGTSALEPATIAQLVIAGLNHAFYMAVFGAILGWAQDLPTGQRIRGHRPRPGRRRPGSTPSTTRCR